MSAEGTPPAAAAPAVAHRPEASAWVRPPAVPPPAAPRFGLAALAAGSIAAVMVPGGPLGVGATVAVLSLAGAVAVARPRRWDPPSAVLGLAALALAGMVAVRDADWLVAIDLLAALVLGSAAVAGGTDLGATLRGALTFVARLGPAPGFVARAVSRDVPAGTFGQAVPALRAAAFAGALLLVFGGLFASADAVFARLVPDLIPDWDLSLLPGQLTAFAVAAALAGALALTGPAYARPRADGAPPDVDLRGAPCELGPRRLRPIEWTLPLVLLNLLFAAFVAVQGAVLVAGHEHVLDTAGLTYSEHVRRGFGQMVAAATLTLAVVAASARFAERRSARQEILLRLLLGGLCLATLAILASALHRLGLVEAAFGYTRVRVGGHAFALWLAGVFVLLIAAGMRRRAAWLPRAVLVLTAASLLAFNASNPDGLVAAGNVERFERTGKLDVGYLTSLSADAAPGLVALPPRPAMCALEAVDHRTAASKRWRSINLGRWRARRAVERRAAAGGECRAWSDRSTPSGSPAPERGRTPRRSSGA